MRPWSAVAIGMLMPSLLAGCASVLPQPASVSALDKARARTHRDRAVDLLVEKGEVKPGARALDRALDHDPTDLAARLWAAWAADIAGQPEREFDHLLQAAALPHPVAEIAIWEAYRSFHSLGQAHRLARVLEQVCARDRTPALVRARARHFLGQTLRYTRELEGSQRAFEKLGMLREWMLIGPFDNDQNAGFERAYPPEIEKLDYGRAYPGKLRPVAWRRVEHLDYDGRVNLEALLDPPEWAAAYLVTHLHSPKPRELAFRLAAYRGIKLWLNGRLLLSDDRAHQPALDQHAVGGRLEAGWNRLLVKVCQRSGRWQLRLRLTDPDGAPIEGLRVETHKHPLPEISSPDPAAAPLIFLDRLAGLEGEGQAVLAAALRVRWKQLNGFYSEAANAADELAEAHPRCPLFWQLAARVHFRSGHQGMALKALRRAESLDAALAGPVLLRAEHEMDARRYERAMRILEPFAHGPQASRAARLLWASLLNQRGWQIDALQAAQALAREQPDRAWIQKLLSDLHRKMDHPLLAMRAYERALRLRADDADTYNKLVDRLVERGQFDDALRLLRAKRRLWPVNVSTGLREARVLMAAGRYDAALEIIDRVERIAPQHWYVFRLRGDVHLREGRRTQALTAYRRALELKPENASLRDYLDHLTGRRDEIFERFERTEPEIESLLAWKPSGKHRDADAVFVLDDHVSHVFADGSSTHRVRQIYLVRNEKGQRRLNHFAVPSSSSFRLEIAETIQPDGSRQEATSIRKGVIHFPSLQPGSVLHVAYRYDSRSSSWMEDHFAMSFVFQGRFPVVESRWVLALPRGKALRFHTCGQGVAREEQEIGPDRVITWTARRMPQLHSEPWRPPLRDIQASVHVSTVESWDMLADWQSSLIQDQFEIDAAIRKKTRELVQPDMTTKQKIEAVYRFVASEIRYLDNDVGIFGKKPDKAVNVFENRYGDCKDKATLMIAMLRELGILAHYAAIRTRSAGRVFWEVPSAQTDHIITFIPKQAGIDRDLFVDGTSRFGHIDYLPARDQGVRALVLPGRGHRIIDTPMLPPESSADRVAARAAIGEDGSLSLAVEEVLSGLFAVRRRQMLTTEGKRDEEWTRFINQRYPGAQLAQTRFRGLDDLGPEVRADYAVRIPGRVREEFDSLRLQPFWPWNPVRTFAPKPSRHSDLFVLHLFVRAEEIEIGIPRGYTASNLPAAEKIETDWFDYSLSCTPGDGRVTCRRELEWKKRLSPRERYREIRKALIRIDRAEEQQLVFKRSARVARSQK